ncbi:MAG: hypothetical protein WBA67_01170 [Jannaschia sp.]
MSMDTLLDLVCRIDVLAAHDLCVTPDPQALRSGLAIGFVGVVAAIWFCLNAVATPDAGYYDSDDCDGGD